LEADYPVLPVSLSDAFGNIPYKVLKNFVEKIKLWNYSKDLTENQFTMQHISPFLDPLFCYTSFETAL
jgi:hypothetical protein